MPALNDRSKEPWISKALDDLILGWLEVTTGKMFGSRAYRAKGVLFAMIGGEGLILTKLQPGQRETAAAENRARPFIGHGKELPAWIEFPLADEASVAAVATMVRRAYENAVAEADAS